MTKSESMNSKQYATKLRQLLNRIEELERSLQENQNDYSASLARKENKIAFLEQELSDSKDNHEREVRSLRIKLAEANESNEEIRQSARKLAQEDEDRIRELQQYIVEQKASLNRTAYRLTTEASAVKEQIRQINQEIDTIPLTASESEEGPITQELHRTRAWLEARSLFLAEVQSRVSSVGESTAHTTTKTTPNDVEYPVLYSEHRIEDQTSE